MRKEQVTQRRLDADVIRVNFYYVVQTQSKKHPEIWEQPANSILESNEKKWVRQRAKYFRDQGHKVRVVKIEEFERTTVMRLTDIDAEIRNGG